MLYEVLLSQLFFIPHNVQYIYKAIAHQPDGFD